MDSTRTPPAQHADDVDPILAFKSERAEGFAVQRERDRQRPVAAPVAPPQTGHGFFKFIMVVVVLALVGLGAAFLYAQSNPDGLPPPVTEALDDVATAFRKASSFLESTSPGPETAPRQAPAPVKAAPRVAPERRTPPAPSAAAAPVAGSPDANDRGVSPVANTPSPKPGLTARRITGPHGFLYINARPWADVWIDDRLAGTTPLADLPVPVGTHEIVWRHPQLGERRQTVDVTVDSLTRLGMDLRP